MRSFARGVTVVEAAVAASIAGSLLAIAVPVVRRDVHGSRLVEATSGLERIGAGALAYAAGRPVASAFPASAPLTPASPPRGAPAADPPGAWDGPTWTALGFRAAPEGVPHVYAFAFDATLGPARSSFAARAHGDLDGDGRVSTFELRGVADETAGPRLDPGMYVEAEVE